MDKHQAVSEGQVKVILRNKTFSQGVEVEKPASLGIFKPTIKPEQTGVFDLVFLLNTPQLKDTVVIEQVEVYSSTKEAIEKNPKEDEAENISFLKEQAWKMDFQTAMAKEKPVFDVVKTYGVWTQSQLDQKQVVASSSGKISFSPSGLMVGKKVRKREVLMSISSQGFSENNQQLKIDQAKVRLDQAEALYNRKKKLFDKQIISKTEFEKVSEAYLIAKNKYQALSSGYQFSGKKVVAPFSGIIQSVEVSNGSFAKQGETLLTILKEGDKKLKTQIQPEVIASGNQIQNVWFKTNAEDWSSIQETGGEVLSISPTVNDHKPFLDVVVDVNSDVNQVNGSFTSVELSVGDSKKGVVIPEKALLEDYGQYSVIVQLSGESFERRMISIGRRNGSDVEITRGLTSGEVVVTTGAYQVKMASMSGAAPAHGHAH
jgi:RND family efflux transporter MFP subunit